MIKYLGIFEYTGLPSLGGKTLFTSLLTQKSEVAIEIHYSEMDNTYTLTHIAILLSNERKDKAISVTYQVFEVDAIAETPEIAKIIARDFSENIIRMREDLLYIFKQQIHS